MCDLNVRTTGVPGGPRTAALSWSVEAPAMLMKYIRGLEYCFGGVLGVWYLLLGVGCLPAPVDSEEEVEAQD